MTTFVAIDFETADYYPDSACAVGLVKVVNNQIVERQYHLIKPPRKSFIFTYLHGITWYDVHRKPTFAQIWPKLRKFLHGADFLAAHNAGFDRKVLYACGSSTGVHVPLYPFLCTVQLARKVWGIYPTNLQDVCDSLGIELNHHYALSDAEACARIIIAAEKQRSAVREQKIIDRLQAAYRSSSLWK